MLNMITALFLFFSIIHNVNHMKKYIDNRIETWCNNTNTTSTDYYVTIKYTEEGPCFVKCI